MDGIMLEFPLCCLSYPADIKTKLDKIISYCIVERSKKVDTAIYERIDRWEEDLPSDFEYDVEEDIKIVLAAEELAIKFGSINNINTHYSEMSEHIALYEYEYGKDAYCRIGKNLCFETRDGKFDYYSLAILCAIQSILGKKSYTRITKEQIKHRYLGYKKKYIAKRELPKDFHVLTDKQISRRVNFLYERNFFRKFTYARRQTFYSTKISTVEKLVEAVMESKISRERKRLQKKSNDTEFSAKIKSRLISIEGKISHDGLRIVNLG